MRFEVTENVPGLDVDAVDALAVEADAGYDLDAAPVEMNPHRGLLAALPEELRHAVEAHALRTGRSPEDVVLDALTTYLRSA